MSQPLRIETPCHEDWNGMTPNERGRHCASCDKTVIDVAGMTPSVATVFLRELPQRLTTGERVCVRAHLDRRGWLSRPGPRRYLLTNGLAAILALSLAGCSGDGPEHTRPSTAPPVEPPTTMPDPHPPMGAISSPPLGAPAPIHPSVRGEVQAAPVPPAPHTMGKMAAPAPAPLMTGDVCMPDPSPTPPPLAP